MGFLISRSAQPCWGELVLTSALLAAFGCGGGGGAPGLFQPPSAADGATQSFKGKSPKEVQEGKTTLKRGKTEGRSVKGVEPATGE
jgi:hypothetical protein